MSVFAVPPGTTLIYNTVSLTLTGGLLPLDQALGEQVSWNVHDASFESSNCCGAVAEARCGRKHSVCGRHAVWELWCVYVGGTVLEEEWCGMRLGVWVGTVWGSCGVCGGEVRCVGAMVCGGVRHDVVEQWCRRRLGVWGGTVWWSCGVCGGGGTVLEEEWCGMRLGVEGGTVWGENRVGEPLRTVHIAEA